MTSNKNSDSVIEIINLHPQELKLLKRIRHKYPFGEITILARNGLPFRIKRAIENDDLTGTEE